MRSVLLGAAFARVPYGPGHEFCGAPFDKHASPNYHLMDQHGCGENDPNGPVYAPRKSSETCEADIEGLVESNGGLRLST